MSIDLEKLENVVKKGSKTIARCPACAEIGRDNKGNHLIINSNGQYACIVFQGISGQEHRKRIFQIVGIKDQRKNNITVKHVSQASPGKHSIIVNDVLGRIGRHFSGYSKKRTFKVNRKINELVLLYKDLLQEADKRKRQQKEAVFNRKWQNLKDEDRQTIVDELLLKGILPNEIQQALNIFGGKVISLV